MPKLPDTPKGLAVNSHGNLYATLMPTSTSHTRATRNVTLEKTWEIRFISLADIRL